MATSVKMDEETKSDLEELQAEIRLATGRRVTQQELPERIVSQAAHSKVDLIESFRSTEFDLSESERDAFHEGMISSGRPTTESDVDGELYG